MNKPQVQLKNILSRCFPDECDAIGPSNLEHLIEGKTKFETPDSGKLFPPITEIFDLLRDSISIIGTFLTIYLAIRKTKNKPPTNAEVKTEWEKSTPVPIS
jgi:hypothetical protein